MEQAPRERLLTRPLVAFMLFVATVVGAAMWTRHPSPDMEGAIEWLSDGDLDGAERRRMLGRVIDLATDAEPVRHVWAGVLAAVALEDEAAFASLVARFGPGRERDLPQADREWLGLGDPLLRNVLAAMSYEAGDDVDRARAKWTQVLSQSQLTANGFAGRLASAAIARLK